MIDSLEQRIGQLLLAKKLTISSAESCTGGLVMHRLTNVPGSSAYFPGGVVAYSNEIKHSLLGVQENTLDVFGAVSEQVAAAMARGVRAIYGTSLAVGITGIAGPGGASEDKPVGLTYIALTALNRTMVERFVWEGDRIANKESSAEAALQIVFDYLDHYE